MKNTKRKWRLEHWHKVSLLLAIYDLLAVNIAYFVALWLRFDCTYSAIDPVYLDTLRRFVPIYSLVCLGVFMACRLYNSIWRFASISELGRCLVATVITGVFHVAFTWLVMKRMPISYYIMGTAFQLVLTLGIRFSYRLILLQSQRSREYVGTNRIKRAMLIGAGNAGQTLLRDINHSRDSSDRIVCIIDDNPNKWHRFVDGIPVVGGREDILLNVEKYGVEKILVAIPSASDEAKRDILNICKESGCEIKNLPSLNQLASGRVSMGDMKDVAVEDLLGREPIRVEMRELHDHINGKTILVTGGGGSIGSELCRQIARYNPRQLIIFDIYENNAYEIQQELRVKYPNLKLEVLIGSVRDSRRLMQIFEQYKPQIVYHAAAHKHVPLMEDSPCESIKNNVIGTYKTAFAAMISGCEKFVLISTDKAVNPTNIMGASKRLCEMVVQSFDYAVRNGCTHKLPMLYTHQEEDMDGLPGVHPIAFPTDFVAVRFGNVLGSNGSVIPLFKKQIAAGGPVTVTHPDIIRYFMTIPEAVSLVMQAGTYAKGGEIFVLDMGAPVKIDELARNLIKLSGYKPDVDIPIVYTGLRPGEKLYEEKLMAEEGLSTTPNALIHIGKPIPFDVEQFLVQLRTLMEVAYTNDRDIIALVASMVSTYHPELGATQTKDETFQKLHREAVGAFR